MPVGVHEISVLRVSMATLEETNAAAVESDDSLRRRDFINIAAVSFAGVGGVAVVLPLINQMNPSADVLALSSIEVDIGNIAEGMSVTVLWRGKPVFVRHRTKAEIDKAVADDKADLPDPATDESRRKSC